jgi:hypothetical protein
MIKKKLLNSVFENEIIYNSIIKKFGKKKKEKIKLLI